METVRINKGNWTGEEADIILYADGKKAYIHDYNMKFRVIERFSMNEDGINITEYKVEIKEGSGKWETTDWKVSTDHDTGEQGWHYATTWNGGSPRESTKDVRLAVAQLIFNIV